MNKLPLEKRVQILSMLCEGSSMRSISRVADVSFNTVAKILVDAGNLERLVAMRNSIKHGSRIGASITIQRANIEDLEAFLDIGHRIGLDRLDIKFVHGLNAPVATREQLHTLSVKLRDWLTAGRFPEAGIEWALWQLEQNTQGIASGLPAEPLYRKERVQCFAPYLTMVISPFGDVYPCCHLFEDNEGYWESTEQRRLKYRIACIREQSLKDIWTNSFLKFRRCAKTIPSINSKGSCGRCTRYSPHNIPLSRLDSLWTEACASVGSERAYTILDSSITEDEITEVFI